jgi:hypothetical protein
MIIRIASLTAMGVCAAACAYVPGGYPTQQPAPRVPQAERIEPIDPYHRDKTPDTPYEVRKAEIERDDYLACRDGPTYPPLFKDGADKDE